MVDHFGIAATTRPLGRFLRLFWLTAGVISLFIGCWQAVATWHLVRAGIIVSGFVAAAADPTAELSHPSVEFTTETGQKIRYMQNGYIARRGRDHVRVIYDPANPIGTATVRDGRAFWMPTVFPILFGSAASGLALASFLSARTDS